MAESRGREIRLFPSESESWKRRGPNHPAFYCVWALRARYFSLPFGGAPRCYTSSFGVPEIVGDSFEAYEVSANVKRNCSSSLPWTKRVNRRVLASVRNFLFDERHKSRDATGRTAECARSYVSARQWLDGE